MKIHETDTTFNKPKDKDGVVINLGDVVYGEDGRGWRVTEIRYGKWTAYPIGAQSINTAESKDLKPHWLTHHHLDWEFMARVLLYDLETCLKWIKEAEGDFHKQEKASGYMKLKLTRDYLTREIKKYNDVKKKLSINPPVTL